jgi:hypothetical protein
MRVLDEGVKEVQVKKPLATTEHHAPDGATRRTTVDTVCSGDFCIQGIEVRALGEAWWERIDIHWTS